MTLLLSAMQFAGIVGFLLFAVLLFLEPIADFTRRRAARLHAPGQSTRSKFFRLSLPFTRLRSVTAVTMALVIALLITAPMHVAHAQVNNRDATGAFIKDTQFYASGARTGPGNTGTPVDVSAYDSAVLLINVTVAGTTLTVNFDNCIDAAGTKCGVHTASSAITTTGFFVVKANNYGRYARVSFTSTGSFTFEVQGVFKPST